VQTCWDIVDCVSSGVRRCSAAASMGTDEVRDSGKEALINAVTLQKVTSSWLWVITHVVWQFECRSIFVQLHVKYKVVLLLTKLNVTWQPSTSFIIHSNSTLSSPAHNNWTHWIQSTVTYLQSSYNHPTFISASTHHSSASYSCNQLQTHHSATIHILHCHCHHYFDINQSWKKPRL